MDIGVIKKSDEPLMRVVSLELLEKVVAVYGTADMD
jgi:hypothetical protein